MLASVQHGHVPVNPGEKRPKVDPEALGEQREGRNGRNDPALLDRRNERSTQGTSHSRLTETALEPQPFQFLPDRFRQAGASLCTGSFRNS